MIITIKGADFSGSNIGTLDTYLVSKSIGAGATHDIPNYVTKNAAVSWTITLSEGYTFGTYSITMGGATVTPTIGPDGKTMTVAIAAVTGKVVISVATINESTGEEEGGTTLVELEITKAYVNYFNEKSSSVNSGQSNSTSHTQYLCCGPFTKEDIPAGSKIIVNSTYNVRMCMWYDPTTKNANGYRGPTITKGTTYDITQSMWDNTDFLGDDASTSDTTTPFTAIAFNVMGQEGDFVADNISDVVAEIKKYITIMVPSK